MKLNIQITTNNDGLITKATVNGKPLNFDLPDFYDNGTRGWSVNTGKEYRLILLEEYRDDTETDHDNHTDQLVASGDGVVFCEQCQVWLSQDEISKITGE